MRFYGTGAVLEPHEDGFDELLAAFPKMPAARNIIVIELDRIMKSCGYGVPLYEFRQQRDSLSNYFDKKPEDEIWAYRKEHNSESLDGLPGLAFADASAD